MKRMIIRFFGWLTRAWFLILFVTAVLATLFWFYSPLFGNDDDGHPFDAIVPRIIVISIMVLFGLLLIILIYMLRARRERKLVDDISSQSADDADLSDEVVQAELSDLRDKLKKAMIKLRKSKRGRRSLYDLPWYVMIGPPGAGKTTAIANSGLQFPLADEIGKEAVGGIGGTRNCDWWFTENAVLIDTAGRYTTQESDAEADNAGWLGFLEPAEEEPHPAADQRRDDCHFAVGSVVAGRDHADGPCQGRPPPPARIARRAGGAFSGLCDLHQGRPHRRLHRVFRRSRQGRARAGLGLHPASRQVEGREISRSPPSTRNSACCSARSTPSFWNGCRWRPIISAAR